MLLLKFMESKPRLLGRESSFTSHKVPDAFFISTTSELYLDKSIISYRKGIVNNLITAVIKNLQLRSFVSFVLLQQLI